MPEEIENGKKVYRVRDLKYSLPHLLAVSALVMLATRMMSMVCDDLVPGVKPLLLDKAGASATQISLVLTTFPSIINFFLCPYVSTLSDKTRTRFGRRMPYLAVSAPILVLLLQMIAWHREISGFVVRIFPSLGQFNTVFFLLAALILMFQVIFVFPGSLMSYLTVDVVPKEYIGRFVAVSTVMATIFRAGFNFCILKPAVENMKVTFAVFGALYLLTFFALSRFVKEGTYPPVDDPIDKDSGFVRRAAEYVMLFFRQCFSHRIYVYTFICIGLNIVSNTCRGMYNILFATKDIHMSVGEYGTVMGYGALGSAVVVTLLSKTVDKYHPMVIYCIGGFFIMAINVFGYFFVRTPQTFAIIGVATTLMYAAQGLAQMPLLVALMPPDKFGQFASANTMVISTIAIGSSYLAGKVTDLFGYRVMFVWDFIITGAALLVLLGIYREWKRWGGRNYVPPAV